MILTTRRAIRRLREACSPRRLVKEFGAMTIGARNQAEHVHNVILASAVVSGYGSEMRLVGTRLPDSRLPGVSAAHLQPRNFTETFKSPLRPIDRVSLRPHHVIQHGSNRQPSC